MSPTHQHITVMASKQVFAQRPGPMNVWHTVCRKPGCNSAGSTSMFINEPHTPTQHCHSIRATCPCTWTMHMWSPSLGRPRHLPRFHSVLKLSRFPCASHPPFCLLDTSEHSRGQTLSTTPEPYRLVADWYSLPCLPPLRPCWKQGDREACVICLSCLCTAL